MPHGQQHPSHTYATRYGAACGSCGAANCFYCAWDVPWCLRCGGWGLRLEQYTCDELLVRAIARQLGGAPAAWCADFVERVVAAIDAP